jgi:hypothetical protein
MNPTGQIIPPLLIFPRKYMKQEMMAHCLYQSTRAIGVDTERDFHPAVSSFQPKYKIDKTRSCYVRTEWA